MFGTELKTIVSIPIIETFQLHIRDVLFRRRWNVRTFLGMKKKKR